MEDLITIEKLTQKYLIICWQENDKATPVLLTRIYDIQNKRTYPDKKYYLKERLTNSEIKSLENNACSLNTSDDIFKYIKQYLKKNNKWGKRPWLK